MSAFGLLALPPPWSAAGLSEMTGLAPTGADDTAKTTINAAASIATSQERFLMTSSFWSDNGRRRRCRPMDPANSLELALCRRPALSRRPLRRAEVFGERADVGVRLRRFHGVANGGDPRSCGLCRHAEQLTRRRCGDVALGPLRPIPVQRQGRRELRVEECADAADRPDVVRA